MLAILTTHPIQYQVPIWRELARRGRIPFEVWYLSDHGVRESLDKEFQRTFRWDIDFLGGYPHRFLGHTGKAPDISRFRGTPLPTPTALFAGKQVRALWINGWQVQAYWQAALHAHWCGIPIWLRGDTNDLHRSHPLKRLPRWILLRQLFKHTDAFLTVGAANRRFYQGFGVPIHKLYAAPHCVDNARFASVTKNLAPQRAALRREWGIPEQATCLLFCGKLIPKKRPTDLLAALKGLIDKTPLLAQTGQMHLLVVGDGELRAALTNQARELEQMVGRSIVTFTGFLNQSEMPKAYVAGDCLVLPSDWDETWGLVVNEALACGKSVVVSDQCGCAEDLARPLGDGHTYPCGDVAQLARCLRIQLDLAEVDRQDTYAKLIANFGIEPTVETVEHLYAKILG